MLNRFSAGFRLGVAQSVALLASVTTATFAMTAPAQAATLQLGRLTFSEVSGDYQITGGFIAEGYYTIQQNVYGPDINLLMAIQGFPRLSTIGILVQLVITNSTGAVWQFYDHELRESPNIPSPEADGLSFAQGISSVRPFGSNRFAAVDEEIEFRDYVNFSAGEVRPGESVVFRYAITDRSPQNLFYLLQRPNFQVGTGFVNPQPPAPVVPPSPTPVVTPQPSPSPTPPVVQVPVEVPSVPEPVETNAVPEPASVLGLLLAGGLLGRRILHRA